MICIYVFNTIEEEEDDDDKDEDEDEDEEEEEEEKKRKENTMAAIFAWCKTAAAAESCRAAVSARAQVVQAARSARAQVVQAARRRLSASRTSALSADNTRLPTARVIWELP